MKIDKLITFLVMLLASIAAINWGLVNFLSFNIVQLLTLGIPALMDILYAIITIAGVAGLISAIIYAKDELL